MPLREFRDHTGVRWLVWEVQPQTAAQRRSGGVPMLAVTGDHSLDATEARVRISDDLARGWLVFESPDERRRLAPVPELWADASLPELEELLGRAGRARPPRRLVE